MDKVQSGGRSINISDEVLCRVAALAAGDVEGVAKLAARKPVTVENIGGAVSVQVRCVLMSGYRAVTAAKQVQLAVKQAVQDMTGVTAVHVNVEVSGIEFES